MFSLCIPTIDRFDTFLNDNLKKYLTFELIDEILICDENGNDYTKLQNGYPQEISSGRLKIYKNKQVLGPFLNKLKVCRLASSEWIVCMDSDNFADSDYFEVAKKYILKSSPSKISILSPCFAKPKFDYTRFAGNMYTKPKLFDDDCLVNTGNYIIHKYLIDNIDISKETENIKKSSACDVVFFNTLLFEQFDLHFHVVKDLEYSHVVHNGSVYLTTCNKFKAFNELVYRRHRALKI
jgi:hypothetical protein